MMAEIIQALAAAWGHVADNLTWFAIIGFAGQAVFGTRFILQWIHSERVGRSEIPLIFWYCSIIGGVLLFIYAVGIGDPVFILGQSTGIVIYGRNLVLIRRERRRVHADA